MSFFAGLFGGLGAAGGEVARTLAEIQREERLQRAQELEAEHRDRMYQLGVDQRADAQGAADALRTDESQRWVMEMRSNPDLVVRDIDYPTVSTPTSRGLQHQDLNAGLLPHQRVQVEAKPYEQTQQGLRDARQHQDDLELERLRQAGYLARDAARPASGAEPKPSDYHRSTAWTIVDELGPVAAEAYIRENYADDPLMMQGYYNVMWEMQQAEAGKGFQAGLEQFMGGMMPPNMQYTPPDLAVPYRRPAPRQQGQGTVLLPPN